MKGTKLSLCNSKIGRKGVLQKCFPFGTDTVVKTNSALSSHMIQEIPVPAGAHISRSRASPWATDLLMSNKLQSIISFIKLLA